MRCVEKAKLALVWFALGFGLLAQSCAPSPGEGMRYRYDSSLEADGALVSKEASVDAQLRDGDVGLPDAMSSVDAMLNCECQTAGSEETRLRSSACGEYEEKRACNGCTWGAWQGEPPACACEPGTTGETREVEGGTGCAKGKRMEQEVCKDDGSGYVWMATTGFDGSAKECAASATEMRSQQGTCRTYMQSRTCSNGCTWGSWQGTEGSCYPDNQYIGNACGSGGTCQCRHAGADTCSPAFTCPDGFRWRTGLCGGVGPVCCEPDCSPMNATGSGSDACPLGYKWTGTDCSLVRGCGGCSGTDCDVLMTLFRFRSIRRHCGVTTMLLGLAASSHAMSVRSQSKLICYLQITACDAQP